jgi:hypothetical protein
MPPKYVVFKLYNFYIFSKKKSPLELYFQVYRDLFFSFLGFILYRLLFS